MRLPRVLLVIVLAFVASACSILPPDVVRELAPSQTQYTTLQAAYQIIIDKHVDKPTSKQLVPGALTGVEAWLKGQQVADAPVVDRPDLTGSEWSDFAKLSASLDAVLTRYPSVKKDLLERAAVDGMARSLNECHTYYLDPDRARTFNKPPAPVSGIGVTINQPDPQSPIEVIDVIPGTPAEGAGVKKGDKFMKVNGEDVTRLTTAEVADRVRGPEGSSVTIEFDRQGSPLTLTITRARFSPRLTDSRLEGGGDIAYVRIRQLISSVGDEAANAMRQMKGARGVILDLRDDPGGELAVAVDVGSLFVKSGTLVYQTGRDGQKNPINVNARRYLGLGDVPMVVLVNKNSASGSEIIAAGVRANGAGIVMGTRTAGCVGSGQPRDLPDGGLLLVTLTKMQDAKTGEDLNGPGRGVVPDQTVEDDPKTPAVDEALQAAIAYVHAHL